uniref:NADH dehydrogenase subunit 4L n=1 Tax=Nemoptera coa TaxID=560912 RepID=UPI0030013F86|nr:NADH dehydrogenase subunit 4L [Nemoptera coa]
MMMVVTVMFISGCLSYSLKRKHLLSMLISLEYIVISLFFFLILYLVNYNYEFFFTMIFLTFSVCEGALGLGILVMVVRTHGNDYFQSFTSLY